MEGSASTYSSASSVSASRIKSTIEEAGALWKKQSEKEAVLFH